MGPKIKIEVETSAGGGGSSALILGIHVINHMNSPFFNKISESICYVDFAGKISLGIS